MLTIYKLVPEFRQQHFQIHAFIQNSMHTDSVFFTAQILANQWNTNWGDVCFLNYF